MSHPSDRPTAPLLEAAGWIGTSHWTRVPRVLEVGLLLLSVAALLAELGTVIAQAAGATASSRGDPLVGYAAVALAGVGTLVGWRHLYLGMLPVAAAPLVAAGFGWDPTTTWSICCFAAMSATLRGAPGLIAAVVLGGANFASAAINGGSASPGQNPVAWIIALLAVASAATGSAVRGHRQYWLELDRRARDAVASRQTAVDRSVAEERVRIARDLHDSVGHHIAVVSMHLGAAQVQLPADAHAARAGLEAARTEIQAVLSETQGILRVLRVGDEERSADPTPAYRRIPNLLDSYRAGGMSVDATVADLDVELSSGTGSAAYRIVQEALTNAQRHGTGVLTLRVGPTNEATVVVEATNARPTTPQRRASTGGFGLAGMRERAQSAGGRLTVTQDDQVFRIRAELPMTREVRQ